MTDFVIVKYHSNLISYVDGLQRKNAEALSFYPKCVFERESEKGRIFLGLLNNEPCGYIYIGSGMGGTLRCHQVCIQYDARRRLYGAMLVVAMEDEAKELSSDRVVLRCGFDLEANKFWSELGYRCINIVDGGIRGNRKINVWEKFLTTPLFEVIGVEPAKGKTDATIWRKNKQLGVVSGFNRGKKLKEYRSMVIEMGEKSLEV